MRERRRGKRMVDAPRDAKALWIAGFLLAAVGLFVYVRDAGGGGGLLAALGSGIAVLGTWRWDRSLRAKDD